MHAPSQPAGPAPSEPDGGPESSALLGRIADGRRHTFVELARDLGAVAPAGIATLLAGLQALGMKMDLDADGVRATAFVPLGLEAIRTALGAGWTIRVARRLESTNSTLMDAIKRADRPRGPALVVTEFQTAGRGRMGRGWASAPGSSLTASFAIEVERGLAQLDGVTLACGLAVQRVVRALGTPARLKWPNDLLVDGRKLAGILVEAHATASDRTTLVIGVGINVAFAGDPVDRANALPAATLAPTAIAVDRNRLVASLAATLADHLATFETAGFAAFAAQWNAEDAFHDQRVALVPGAGPATHGICRGVDDTGALLVDVDGTRRRFIAGDVSLRALADDLKAQAA